jgi:hypothetical protein|tara:strand:- start:1763 stop:1990 length:228 start_codon:yes stop_codon:yes gene_type:complete
MTLYEQIEWVKDINDVHPRHPEKGTQALKHVFYKDGTDQKYSFEEWNIIVEEGEKKFEEKQKLINTLKNLGGNNE